MSVVLQAVGACMSAEEAAHPAANGQQSGSNVLAARTIPVCLKDFEAETRCAVCLGIVKDCRLVSGCMHRFCSECIEKWLRVASEPACPQCRMQMQSRRDCKRDSRFDRLMQQLYGDLQGFEEQMENALEDPLVAKGRELGRQLASALEAQRAKRATPAADADKPAAASAPAGSAAAPQQAKRKAKAESPAPRQDSSSAGPSSSKAADSKASKEAKAGKQPAAKRVKQAAPWSKSPEEETGLAEEEEEAMQLAQQLAAKATEARRKEAERIQPMLQVTISLPSSEGAGSEQGSTLHAMVPTKATAAQLLQAIKGLTSVSCPEAASLQVKNPLKKIKTKATEGCPEQKLEPERTLGWAASRLKSCKEDLQLHIDNSNQ